jgi:hypothetical protein
MNLTLGCQEVGSDDLLAKMAYVLLDAALGDSNRHFVRAGARVCLANLIRVGFPLGAPDVVLSATVVKRRMDYHTVTHDVYAAGMRRGPLKGHETFALLPAEFRGERDVARGGAFEDFHRSQQCDAVRCVTARQPDVAGAVGGGWEVAPRSAKRNPY